MKLVYDPELSDRFRSLLTDDSRNGRVYYWGKIKILVSEDCTPKWGWLLHVSVSRPDKYPSWDEIRALKEHFFGDRDAMMVLPKKEDYVNIHEWCFHIWQCPETWGIR